MYNRSFQLSGLPDEIWLFIFQCLNDESLMKTRLVSHDFFRLINDPILWKIRYTQHHGLLHYEMDIKEQTIAAQLFKAAKQHTRFDLAQQVFQQLAHFLFPHRAKQWAKYYLGNLHLHGWGVKKNRPHGETLLLECANDHHVDAIIDCLKDTTNLQMKMYFKEFEELNQYISCLQAAYQKGLTHASIGLAYLYWLDMDGRQYFNDAEALAIQWIKCSIEQGHCELVRFYIELISLDATINVPMIIQSLIKQHASNKKLIAELYLALATHYHDKNDAQSYFNTLVTAAEHHHPHAIVLLGNLYEKQAAINDNNQGDLSHAYDVYLSGVQRNQGEATNHFCLLTTHLIKLQENENPNVDRSGMSDIRIDVLYDAFLQGNSSAALWIDHLGDSRWIDRMIANNRADLPETRNLEIIIWKQLATQCGKHTGLNELKAFDLSNDAKPYAACALYLIYQFGLFKSTELSPDRQIAFGYLQSAIERNPSAPREYLEMAKKLKVFSTLTINHMEADMRKLGCDPTPPSQNYCLVM